MDKISSVPLTLNCYLTSNLRTKLLMSYQDPGLLRCIFPVGHICLFFFFFWRGKIHKAEFNLIQKNLPPNLYMEKDELGKMGSVNSLKGKIEIIFFNRNTLRDILKEIFNRHVYFIQCSKQDT